MKQQLAFFSNYVTEIRMVLHSFRAETPTFLFRYYRNIDGASVISTLVKVRSRTKLEKSDVEELEGVQIGVKDEREWLPGEKLTLHAE